MTPQQFIAKWKHADLSERSACQQHFLDLCELLGQPKPAEVDPNGDWYTFENGVEKTDGGKGFADVWMQGKFGWEYKGKHKNLRRRLPATAQVPRSAGEPAAARRLRPRPLRGPHQLHRHGQEGLRVRPRRPGRPGQHPRCCAARLHRTRRPCKPGQTQAAVTEEVAGRFARLADGHGRPRRPGRSRAAHFLMKLMFCMFAEDIDLLPRDLFARTVANASGDPARLSKLLHNLFEAMAKGEPFGADDIAWFNGGLFADADVIDLTRAEIDQLLEAARCDWSSVEPTIFGTLFERTLDPAKRSQIGAHYTSREDIETLLQPVLLARCGGSGRRRGRRPTSSGRRCGPRRAGPERRKRRADSKAEREFEQLHRRFSPTGWRTSPSSTRPAARAISCTSPSTCCSTWRKKSSPTPRNTTSAHPPGAADAASRAGDQPLRPAAGAGGAVDRLFAVEALQRLPAEARSGAGHVREHPPHRRRSST